MTLQSLRQIWLFNTRNDVLAGLVVALALIPDDDDEELVEKARANRAKRLAAERETQQAFSRSAKGLGERACWLLLAADMF